MTAPENNSYSSRATATLPASGSVATPEVTSGPLLLSLVVPCCNEEHALPQFYRAVCLVLDELRSQQITGEFIFVDDGSRDKTTLVMDELAQGDKRVHYVVLSRNFGKEAALLAGLQRARGQIVVTMDADGQDPPRLIPQMLQSVLSGECDCASTRRVTRKGEPVLRSFFARMFYRIMRMIADVEVVDGARDFHLMNRAYVDAIISLPERSRFSKGILPWIGFRSKWFEFENVRRTAGETKWSFWKLFHYSLDGIMAFSAKPLAIASVTGVLLFVLSILLIVFIAARRIIQGDPVAGWASTICIILFCSGIQLFTTGILGAYLSKAYTEVKQRPHYLIKREK